MTSDVLSDDDIVRALVEPRSSGELAQQFGVSRQAIFLRLDRLRAVGRVEMTGDGRGARWRASNDLEFAWRLGDGTEEAAMWREIETALARAGASVGDDGRRILRYAITEMLNNAIDHSAGTEVRASVRRDGDDLEIVIADDGIGVWRSIQEHFNLASAHDAISHLAKGQQTTFPERHSGQGIFFTSKAVDGFVLESENSAWKVDSIRDDMTVGPGSGTSGTRVRLRLNVTTRRSLKAVFDGYSEPGEPGIDRTVLRVALSQTAKEFISRSEAKKLSVGLEGFGTVVLDFAGVTEVGQGFVDELFRVWANEHRDVQLVPVNMNEDVTFMFNRGVRTE